MKHLNMPVRKSIILLPDSNISHNHKGLCNQQAEACGPVVFTASADPVLSPWKERETSK